MSVSPDSIGQSGLPRHFTTINFAEYHVYYVLNRKVFEVKFL
jgi:hypothetical protein